VQEQVIVVYAWPVPFSTSCGASASTFFDLGSVKKNRKMPNSAEMRATIPPVAFGSREPAAKASMQRLINTNLTLLAIRISHLMSFAVAFLH
jgi:hypothetical protein